MTIHRDEMIRALPYARRYARALTGSQGTGDAMVADALQTLLGQRADTAAVADRPNEGRYVLYDAVTRSFLGATGSGNLAIARWDGILDLDQRILLLLSALEEVPVETAAPMVGQTPEEAARRLRDARSQLRSAAATDVLIIEDEPIIAMDIEELVRNCGHNVVGVAASEAEAVQLAAERRPGLILADINLGLGGDGAAAVARIVQGHQVPVIFVTAYPERLLAGEAMEPTFIITKPFEPMTLAIATYQAVTGGVRPA